MYSVSCVFLEPDKGLLELFHWKGLLYFEETTGYVKRVHEAVPELFGKRLCRKNTKAYLFLKERSALFFEDGERNRFTLPNFGSVYLFVSIFHQKCF